MFILTAVENYQIRVSDHLHEQGFHIVHIDLEGTGIHGYDVLCQIPVTWHIGLIELIYRPQRIVLYQNSSRMMFFIQHLQGIRVKVFRIFDDLDHRIHFFQAFLIVLLFSLFAENQKRFVRNLKITLMNGKIQKLGFTTL